MVYTPRFSSRYARPWKPVHFDFSFLRVEFTFTRPVVKWPKNAVLWSENHQILALNRENLHQAAILLPLKGFKMRIG